MKEQEFKSFQRKTQRDYSLSFKLEIVAAVEKANLLTSRRSFDVAYRAEVQFWFGCENM